MTRMEKYKDLRESLRKESKHVEKVLFEDETDYEIFDNLTEPNSPSMDDIMSSLQEFICN